MPHLFARNLFIFSILKCDLSFLNSMFMKLTHVLRALKGESLCKSADQKINLLPPPHPI